MSRADSNALIMFFEGARLCLVVVGGIRGQPDIRPIDEPTLFKEIGVNG